MLFRSNVGGLEVSIENPKGSYRFKVDQDRLEKLAGKAAEPVSAKIQSALEWLRNTHPKPLLAISRLRELSTSKDTPPEMRSDLGRIAKDAWATRMNAHYGYVLGSVGKDKEQIDVFLGPHANQASDHPVFIVDQVDPKTGKFDEHKVMIGYQTESKARAAYQSNYVRGWKGLGAISRLTFPEFREWVKNPALSKKPYSDTIQVKVASQPKPAPSQPEPIPQKPQKGPPSVETRARTEQHDLHTALLSSEIAARIAGAPDSAFPAMVQSEIASWVHQQIGVSIAGGDKARVEALNRLILKNGDPNPEIFDPKTLTALREQAIHLQERTQKNAAREQVLHQSQDQMAVALSQAELPPEGITAFREGWLHAIEGGTRSNLGIEENAIAGYEAAQKWLTSEEGKAIHHSGKKAEGVGVVLKRLQDTVHEGTEHLPMDTEKAIEQVFTEVSRARLFDPTRLQSDATGAVRRYSDLLRAKIRTFKDVYGSYLGGERRRRFGVTPKEAIVNYVTSGNSRDSSHRASPEKGHRDRLREMVDFSREYTDRLARSEEHTSELQSH